MIGTVQYDGRVFEYEYPEPSEDEISERALEIQVDEDIGEEEAKSRAKSELAQKLQKDQENNVLELLKSQIPLIENIKAEVGISQRTIADPNALKNLGNGAVREKTRDASAIGVESGKNFRDPRFVPDTTIDEENKDLISFLNHRLYERKQKRLEAIQKAGGSGESDPMFKSDLEIPAPTALLGGRESGNPLGPQYHEMAMRFGGSGDPNAQFMQSMKYIDRYGKTYIPPSRELVGYTFITRPHCNLSSENLANVREFAPLLYAPSRSIGMAIRGYLDSELYKTQAFSTYLDTCPFYDPRNPFMVPIVNALTSINGFPDVNLGIETSEGGFFSEQQTNVTGYDRLAKGQELSLTFRDYFGSPILAMHEYWAGYMGRLGDGTMHQYADDIESNLMGYTVSIYRFVMDPTNRFIIHWAKATGCFPKLAPSGAIFNVNENERIVAAVNNFSVQYFAHHIGYNDPLILKEFNMLAERYCKGIEEVPQSHVIASGMMNNHACLIPYISQEFGMNELQWRLPPDVGGTVDKDYHFEGRPYNEFTGLSLNENGRPTNDVRSTINPEAFPVFND